MPVADLRAPQMRRRTKLQSPLSYLRKAMRGRRLGSPEPVAHRRNADEGQGTGEYGSSTHTAGQRPSKTAMECGAHGADSTPFVDSRLGGLIESDPSQPRGAPYDVQEARARF